MEGNVTEIERGRGRQIDRHRDGDTETLPTQTQTLAKTDIHTGRGTERD